MGFTRNVINAKKTFNPPSRLHSDMLHLTKIETFTCGPFGLVLNSSTRSMRRLGLTVPSMTLYVNPISCRWTATIWSMLVHWDTITLDNKGETRHEDHIWEGNMKIVINCEKNRHELWIIVMCNVLPFVIITLLSDRLQFRDDSRDLEGKLIF